MCHYKMLKNYLLFAFLWMIFIPLCHGLHDIDNAIEDRDVSQDLEPYYFIPLGKIRTANYSFAYDINHRLQIVGNGNQAFVWDASNTKEVFLADRYWSEALAINDHGAIVGIAANSGKIGRWPGQAYYWSPVNGLKIISMENKTWSIARDVNNAGFVTGYAMNIAESGSFIDNEPESGVSSFIWRDGAMMQALPTLGGSHSFALALNNAPQPLIVGASKNTDNKYNAFQWQQNSGISSLVTPDGQQSFATSVNDAGDIVGWLGDVPGAYFPNYVRDPNGQPYMPTAWLTGHLEVFTSQAVLWKDNQIIELESLTGLPNSIALDINTAGQIVGFAATEEGETKHAFLYDPRLGMIDLSGLVPSHVYLQAATSINDFGQIVAWGLYSEGENPQDYRPFLLAPKSTTKVADLTLDLAGLAAINAKIGDELSFAISLQNQGEHATDAVVDLHMKGPLSLTGLPAGCQFKNNSYQCSFGMVAANSSVKTTPFVGRVDGVGQIAIEAHVQGQADVILLRRDEIYDQSNFSSKYIDVINDELIVEPRYEIIDLGPLPDEKSSGTMNPWRRLYHAYGINNHGEIVGKAGDYAFFKENLKTTFIGDCQAISIACLDGGGWQELSAVNDAGMKVGTGHFSNGYGAMLSSALVMRPDGSRVVLPFDDTVPTQYARHVNNSGQVVGFAQNDQAETFGFFWDEVQGLRYFPDLNDDHYAFAINNLGLVLGTTLVNTNQYHPFLWSETGGSQVLAQVSQQNTFALDLNDNGVIVGWVGSPPERNNWSLMVGSNPNAGPSAWYYRNLMAKGNALVLKEGEAIDLGSGMAYAINNSDKVVGYLSRPGDIVIDSESFWPRTTEFKQAFIYDVKTKQLSLLKDLIIPDRNTPAIWTNLYIASDINDKGEIIGWGQVWIDGVSEQIPTHGFLLRPLDDSALSDVSIVTHNVSGVYVNESFQWSLSVTNLGQLTTDATLAFMIPKGIVIEEIPGICDEMYHRVTCQLIALEKDVVLNLEFTGKVTQHQSLHIPVKITSIQRDAVNSNNSAVWPITVIPKVDLNLSLAVDAYQVAVNEQVTTTVIKNHGVDATPYTLEMVFSAGLAARSMPAGCQRTENKIRCAEPDQKINAGEDITLAFDFVALSADMQTVTVQVKAQGNDLNTSDNTDTLTFLVQNVEPPAIEILHPKESSVFVNEDALQLPLEFAISHWLVAKNGRHYHWSLDGKDQGPRYDLSPIMLNNLEIGSHNVGIVLVEADHQMTEVKAQVNFDVVMLAVPTISFGPEVRYNLYQTHADDAMQIPFTLENWQVGEGLSHYHVLIDGVDQGPRYEVAPIDVSMLANGVHTVTVKLVDANHQPVDVEASFTVEILKPSDDLLDITSNKNILVVALEQKIRYIKYTWDSLVQEDDFRIAWFINNVKQAELAVGEPIMLPKLKTGRHEITLKLILNETGSVYASDSMLVTMLALDKVNKIKTDVKPAIGAFAWLELLFMMLIAYRWFRK